MWSLSVRIKREKQIGPVSALQVVLPRDNHQLKGQRSLSPASLPISLVLAVKGCDELIWFSVLLTNVVVRTSCRVIRTSCCGSCSIWLTKSEALRLFECSFRAYRNELGWKCNAVVWAPMVLQGVHVQVYPLAITPGVYFNTCGNICLNFQKYVVTS